jgi:hypothetical protein
MRIFYRTGLEPADDYDLAAMLVRVTLTLLCGGLLVLGWRLLAQDRPRLQIPLRRRALLNVEDAIRWRPEF